MKNLITNKHHQKSILTCNCLGLGACSLDQACMINSIMYEAEVIVMLHDNLTKEKNSISSCKMTSKNAVLITYLLSGMWTNVKPLSWLYMYRV